MLSREQQEIIENSLWVVNTALKEQELQADEDLRQSAILYMCKCLERFDPTKNIKWTTYAYKSVFLYIKRTHWKDVKKRSMFVDDNIYEIREPSFQGVDEEDCVSDSMYMIENIKKLCNAEERKILDLKLQGYKVVEISSIMRCSTSKINGCMQSIKDKARELEL